MDPETGQLVVVAITSVGALVWLTALATMLRASRDGGVTSVKAAERFEIDGQFPAGTIVGEAEVEGQPEELSTKLAGLLARDGMGPGCPVKIVARDRREVTFEPAGSSMIGFRGGRIRLTPSGARTRIDYAIRTSPRGYLIGGWMALGLGLVALIAAPSLVYFYVLPSPNPNVRAQSIQVCQMAHFLWPPFLFAHLSRQPGRMIRGRMESLVHNLPYA